MADNLTRLKLAIKAVDPVDGRLRHVWVPEGLVHRAVDFGPVSTIELQKHVPLILRLPRAVWENQSTGDLMYVGQPEHVYNFDGDAVADWHGSASQLFLVFVDGNKFVRTWNWSDCLIGQSWRPRGWNQFTHKVL